MSLFLGLLRCALRRGLSSGAEPPSTLFVLVGPVEVGVTAPDTTSPPPSSSFSLLRVLRSRALNPPIPVITVLIWHHTYRAQCFQSGSPYFCGTHVHQRAHSSSSHPVVSSPQVFQPKFSTRCSSFPYVLHPAFISPFNLITTTIFSE